MFELRMSLLSLMVALAWVLIFQGPCPGMAAPPSEPDDDTFDLENYDLNSEMDWEKLDVNIYGDSYDYDDQQVREMNGWNTIIYNVARSRESRLFTLSFLTKDFSKQLPNERRADQNVDMLIWFASVIKAL